MAGNQAGDAHEGTSPRFCQADLAHARKIAEVTAEAGTCQLPPGPAST